MKADVQHHDVAVTAGALATALGPDMTTACAAARAGLSRARELDSQPIRSDEDGSLMYVVGHVVDAVVSGFEGEMRLIELGAWALTDLLPSLSADDRARTGLFVAIPPPDRCDLGNALIAEGDEPRERLVDDIDPARVLARIAGRAGLAPRMSEAFTEGHAAFGHAVRAAAAALEQGHVEAAIVGGVDSLLEGTTLEWLRATARLKTPNESDGVAPGEAAGFFLLRRGVGLKDTTGAPALRIRATALAQEDEGSTLLSAGRPLGRALTSVLIGITQQPAAEQATAVRLFCDQNGERFRAQEWGYALSRGIAASAPLGRATWSLPAVEHGDTASAAGAVALATALTSTWRERPDQRASAIGIVGGSDGPARSAVLLTTET